MASTPTGKNGYPLTDENLNIAMGVYPNLSSVHKFGKNTVVATGSKEELWDGNVAYIWPTTAAITHVRAGVDSAITQGAVVEVQGLDDDYALTVQTKALDGTNSTTEVALDTPLRRVFRMKMLDDTAMDQQIWAGDDDFVVAAAAAIIQIGKNQTQMAIYTVPASHTAYVTAYYAAHNPLSGSNVTSMDVELWSRDNANGYAPQLKHQRGIPNDASFHHEFKPYVKFTEKSDIYLTCTPITTQAASVSGGFDLILVND